MDGVRESRLARAARERRPGSLLGAVAFQSAGSLLHVREGPDTSSSLLDDIEDAFAPPRGVDGEDMRLIHVVTHGGVPCVAGPCDASDAVGSGDGDVDMAAAGARTRVRIAEHARVILYTPRTAMTSLASTASQRSSPGSVGGDSDGGAAGGGSPGAGDGDAVHGGQPGAGALGPPLRLRAPLDALGGDGDSGAGDGGGGGPTGPPPPLMLRPRGSVGGAAAGVGGGVLGGSVISGAAGGGGGGDGASPAAPLPLGLGGLGGLRISARRGTVPAASDDDAAVDSEALRALTVDPLIANQRIAARARAFTPLATPTAPTAARAGPAAAAVAAAAPPVADGGGGGPRGPPTFEGWRSQPAPSGTVVQPPSLPCPPARPPHTEAGVALAVCDMDRD